MDSKDQKGKERSPNDQGIQHKHSEAEKEWIKVGVNFKFCFVDNLCYIK